MTQPEGAPASAPIWAQTYSYDRYDNRTSVTASGNITKLEKPEAPRVPLPADRLAFNIAPSLPGFFLAATREPSQIYPAAFIATQPDSGSLKHEHGATGWPTGIYRRSAGCRGDSYQSCPCDRIVQRVSSSIGARRFRELRSSLAIRLIVRRKTHQEYATSFIPHTQLSSITHGFCGLPLSQ